MNEADEFVSSPMVTILQGPLPSNNLQVYGGEGGGKGGSKVVEWYPDFIFKFPTVFGVGRGRVQME